jgi:hypothetical protein
MNSRKWLLIASGHPAPSSGNKGAETTPSVASTPNRKIEAFPTQEAYGLVAFTNDQSTLHGHNMQTLNPGFEMALH